MTVTINVTPEKEAAFKAQAQAQGLSVEEWLLQLARRASSEPSPVSQSLVDVCAMVSGLTDDMDFSRNPSTSRAADL